MGERPAAPRDSACPPYDELVSSSFRMFPGPGFRAAKPAIWNPSSNRRHLFARIDILALPSVSAKRARRLLGQSAGKHISYFLPKP
jgi:hypothetical protein